MPKRKPPDQPGVPEWVLTYGDLMSLLLCFFILLAAFSEIKQPREYQRVLDAIKDALGSTGGIGLTKINESDKNSIISQLAEQAKREGQKLSTDEAHDPSVKGRQQKAQVLQPADRIAIGAALEFDAGSFEISAAMQQQLKFDIAPKVRGIRYLVYVSGHSWGQEDRARSGLSQYELSFRRAQAVVDYLTEECQIDQQILRVLAAGDQEPAPGGLDLSDSGVANRRVQLYQTGLTIGELHPDPNFTGRDSGG